MVERTANPSRGSNKTKLAKFSWGDRVGSWLGAACLVHCLALPLMVGMMPWIGLNFLVEEEMGEMVHYAIHGGAYGLAGLAILWGLGRHRALRVTAAFVAALGVVLVGFEIGEGSWEGRVVMVGGALGLAWSHRFNRKLCESCPDDGSGPSCS